MRNWLGRRRERPESTLQQGETHHQSDTISQLVRSKCLNHRLQCQLTAAQGRIADLNTEVDYLRRLREYEGGRARDEVRKLAAEIHALQNSSLINDPRQQIERGNVELPGRKMDKSELHMDGI
ncbi:hypothetical protein HIM_09206 [Hirsutella minnesotensis 3608]|uniref:Uncharacterized protein n=1 Tax=Hirsutella minnesotensis 3608 TaxID=1043627 RepID=A0A0F7ZSI4_9HYPO|nr:hypothetical protein HIM_09206 [Hirsutella minnesotensis 3608]